jgi:O-antigen ligase
MAVRGRWLILIGLATSAELAGQFLFDRSIFQKITTSLVFDPGSYWYRKMLFDFAWAAVLKRPLLGVGLGDWERPAWMGSSIDNLYLFTAVRNGLPAPLWLGIAVLSALWLVGRKRFSDPELGSYQSAYLISIGSTFIVCWSVAMWGAVFALFLFFLGSGLWMIDEGTGRGGVSASPGAKEKAVPKQVGATRTGTE